jgi:hypothetical protein
VSYDVITALTEARVTNDVDAGDGFQLTFTLARSQLNDFSLLQGDALAPNTRIALGVALGVVPEMLIDGYLERHELTPEDGQRGASLTVSGAGILAKLDREQRNEDHTSQSVSTEVRTILSTRYSDILTLPTVREPPANPTPNPQQLTPQQRHQSDLAYIRGLAQNSGFVFCAEYPTVGVNSAYFGPKYASSAAQDQLRYRQGGISNLKSLSFANDALGPVGVSEGARLDTDSMSVVTVPGTPVAPSGMAASPARPLRTQRVRCSARFDQSQMNAISEAIQRNAPAPVTGSGEIDSIRYGAVLRANRKVVISGTGGSYNGEYQVSSVTHTLRRGEYNQSFRVLRDGTRSTR